MPIRRLVDYTGITTWVISLIFVLGVFYSQQIQNTAAIEEGEKYMQRVADVEKSIVMIKEQILYQREWQQESMSTLKDLVLEMKATNKGVMRNSFKLEAIANSVEVQRGGI